MEKLRIHKMKYRNRGMANKKLKGVNEFHVIFKFNTDKEATDFITQVKEWHYGLEKVGEKIKTALKDETPEEVDYTPPWDRNKDAIKEPIDEQKTVTAKKPAPAKRKTGRPPKKNIQGQKR